MRSVDEIRLRAFDRNARETNDNLQGRRRLREVARAILLAAVVVGFTSQWTSVARAAEGEIRIGNTMPYSGPASAYGVIGKTIAAYFRKVNAEGGINGRKINFISYDDSYNPQKTIEATRKLVEEDKVLFIFVRTPRRSRCFGYTCSHSLQLPS